MANSFFDKVEQKTNVKKEDRLSIAKSIQHKDLSDESEIRRLISDIGELAGREVSKEKEDKIVEAILKNKVPKNLDGML